MELMKISSKEKDLSGIRKSYEQVWKQDSHFPVKRKRSNIQSTEIVVQELTDDGYSWRKYGQKEILGSKYPRSYFRCTYKEEGCAAVKKVQRIDEGDAYQISYKGLHTCSNGARIIPGSTSGASDSQSFKISFGVDECRALEAPTELTGTESFTITGIPFFGSKGTNTPDSERETYAKCSQNQNADVTSQIRLDESIISTIHNADVTSQIRLDESIIPTIHNVDSTFSANDKITKEGEIETSLTHCRLRNVVNLGFSSWPTAKYSKSTDCSLQRLLSAFQDVEVKKIGIYGAGGIGKTTLMKAFLSRDDVKRSFDLVLWVTIPRCSSRRKIQNSLIQQLSLNVPNIKSDDEVAMILLQTLLARKFILFLDDVWEYIDLPMVGIPIGNLDNDYMIILTTISIHICEAMEVDRTIEAQVLSRKESLQLFRFHVGNVMVSEDIEPYGRAIVDECSGLPLAIKVAGSALRMDSSIFAWKSTVKNILLTNCLQCTDDGLMVEMHGFLRDLALVILSDAKGLQMLLIRYFRSILSQKTLLSHISNPTFEQPEGHLSILKAGDDLSEPPSEEEWEEAKMVFLMDNTLSSLPKRPACSKLLALFLQRNSCLRVIPSSLFENMSSLQILNLSKTRIKSLPQSLTKLECLQVLILRNCQRLFYLPPTIGALKHLLVLDVHGTEICQLPDQICELLCLVHLQVCFYGSMDEDECAMLPPQLISKGIMSNLVQLKELSINVYPGDPRWTKVASDVTTEVSNLKLCSLSFHFPDIKNLEYFIDVSPAWLHRTLTHFKFVVGHDVKRVVSHVSDYLEHEYYQQDRCLRFVNGEGMPDAVGKVLSQATAFYVDHHLTAQSLTQFGRATINDLKICVVRDCPKLKAIINSTKRTGNFFPFLELLSIHYSWNLCWIWAGPIRAGSLSRLRRLSVHSCPKLELILCRSMVAVLSNLEELTVEDCQSLKNVISSQDQSSADHDIGDNDFCEPNVTDVNSIEDVGNDQMEVDPPDAAELRLKVLKLHYLPKLVNIWNSGDIPCLEYISIYNCPRMKNLDLKSPVEATIKEIKAETCWWDGLEWRDPALPAKLQGRFKEIQSDDIWNSM
ncbi:probable disease resistance protein At4g27220 isoform X2 [Chenopodium quinoa]|uniref:probable disease resistance protein At4g27220 isoform X2 n=1 Tax=Chenopodium quinoa TaxID=63459 RepID=UPI000B77C3A4|nr:probable disease resistance protein At4g27220 isoform X2 [Chenopodium quinoa]